MIKCNYFRKRTEYDDYGRSKLVYSAMSEFNKWDQHDVESIISIDTCSNEHGEVETIVVYYNVRGTSDE
mgnify:CR=1 FL=1